MNRWSPRSSVQAPQRGLPALLRRRRRRLEQRALSTTAKTYPRHLRRIRFEDPESGRTLVLLTNNTTLPVLTVWSFYKSRWQVEVSRQLDQAFDPRLNCLITRRLP